MGALLGLVGLVLLIVGGIWLFIEGLRESILWAIGMLFIPFVSLIFVISHWETAKRPFLTQLGGWVLVILGTAMSHPHVR
ncbi:hypothetical protein HY251_01640 [bacterium]|nr:hypothetical protein [bacterium]